MALTPEQRSVIKRSLAVARRKGASPRERKALVEALLVESGARDLDYGDRDSEGALQQRPSTGWGPASESLETDVAQFLSAARKANRGRGSAGQLAQSVQRSAFPGRYDERGGEAEGILKNLGGGKTGTSRSSSPAGKSSTRTITETTPGVDRSDQRKQVKLAYLAQRGRPGSLLELKAGLDENADTPSQTTSRTERVAGGKRAASRPGKASGKASGEQYDVLESFYRGPGGINIKNGKRVGRNFVDGHEGHVHAASGPKQIKKIAEEAERRGLAVGEHPDYGGVDPVHVPGSLHYRRQAVDVSGGTPEQLADFSRWLARRRKRKS